MSKKYNIENCDILNHNGRLILVYDDEASSHQKVLAYAKSYHDLNEKGMKIFGGEDWMNFLVWMNENYSSDMITRLLADMFAHHKDAYISTYEKDSPTLSINALDDNILAEFSLTETGETTQDGHRLAKFDMDSLITLPTIVLRILADGFEIKDCDLMSRKELLEILCEVDVDIDDYDSSTDQNDKCEFKMKVVRTDKNGHRWAAFDKTDIEKLDDEDLFELAEDMGIPNCDLKSPCELIDAICAEESDIDSDEYNCIDDCDGNCGDCECADLSDDIEIPEMHDTGKLDAKGRKIFEYDRHEIEDLPINTLCDMADSLLIDLDEIEDKADLIDKLCNVAALVDSNHEDWPHEVVSKVEVENASKNKESQYESVDGPRHYNGTECIEEMRNLYGDDAVRWFCVCNAYKYRFRKGNKPGQDAAQDEAKARWYEKYASDMMRNTQY